MSIINVIFNYNLIKIM